MSDPLKPPPSLLAKIGSIVVHTDEYLSVEGHNYDREAINALLAAPDVREWLEAMAGLALVPQKRRAK